MGAKDDLKVKNFQVNKILAIVDTNLLKGLGHSSLLFLDKQGRGICYNTSQITDIFGAITGKDINYKMNRIFLSKQDTSHFFKTGKLPFRKSSSCLDVENEEFLTYNRYIMLPVKTPKAGKAILDAANDNFNNPGKYNLYERNCNHLVQEALAKANLNYAPTKGDAKKMFRLLDKVAKSFFLLNPKAAKKVFDDAFEESAQLGIFPTASLEQAEKVAVENGYVTGDLPLDKNYIKPLIQFLSKKKNKTCKKTFVKNVIKFYEKNKELMSPEEQSKFLEFISVQKHKHRILSQSQKTNSLNQPTI